MWRALCKPPLPTLRCHHLGGNATPSILLLLNKQSLEVHSSAEASLQNTEKAVVVYNHSIAPIYLNAKGADIRNWFSSVATNAIIYSSGERYFFKLQQSEPENWRWNLSPNRASRSFSPSDWWGQISSAAQREHTLVWSTLDASHALLNTLKYTLPY